MGISTIVRVQRAFDCTAEAIYDAWLDPEVARRFWFATPPSGQVARCEIEPGVNGRSPQSVQSSLKVSHVSGV